MVKSIFVLLLLVIIDLLSAERALAWGPGVHMVTALSSFGAISQILPSVASIISAYPLEYMYGCLSADFFIGKSKKKKASHPHNWEGGFRFLGEVVDDQEAAYAYGFLSHLASDVVAHNYFVPNLINTSNFKKRRGHFYWEIKADYLVGPSYTRMAREILRMDHLICDDLLNQLSGKRRNGIRAKKQIYTQTVRFSNYLYEAHPILFNGKVIRPRVFQEYVAVMVNLSCRLVTDFLTHPSTSPCLLHDPLGKQNLRLARGKRMIPRLFQARRSVRSFSVDQEILNL